MEENLQINEYRLLLHDESCSGKSSKYIVTQNLVNSKRTYTRSTKSEYKLRSKTKMENKEVFMLGEKDNQEMKSYSFAPQFKHEIQMTNKLCE